MIFIDGIALTKEHINVEVIYKGKERGIISGFNTVFVFVKYYNNDGVVNLGSEATSAKDLKFG